MPGGYRLDFRPMTPEERARRLREGAAVRATKAEDPAIWERRVEGLAASGRNCREYAKEIGINPHKLAGWLWKLRRRAGVASTPARARVARPKVGSQSASHRRRLSTHVRRVQQRERPSPRWIRLYEGRPPAISSSSHSDIENRLRLEYCVSPTRSRCGYIERLLQVSKKFRRTCAEQWASRSRPLIRSAEDDVAGSQRLRDHLQAATRGDDAGIDEGRTIAARGRD